MFKQIELSYNFDALEPNIDAKTMEIHYGKHHAAYTNNLNDALKNNAPQFLEKPIEEILANLEVLPEQIRGAVRNNGGGFYNHNLYFEIMGPNAGGEPTGELAEKIKEAFGSFDAFKEEFSKAAATRFGSGWAWLVVNKPFGRINCAYSLSTRCVRRVILCASHGILVATTSTKGCSRFCPRYRIPVKAWYSFTPVSVGSSMTRLAHACGSLGASYSRFGATASRYCSPNVREVRS